MKRVRKFRRERRYRKRDGWFLECGERERSREEGNANCRGSNTKEDKW